MNKYKIKSYLPNEELGEEVRRDYDFISNEKNNFNERVERLRGYVGDFNAVEEHNSNEKYLIEEDNDGLYLLEKIN